MTDQATKRWYVSAEVTISVGTWVDAATEKEARGIAEEREVSDSCATTAMSINAGRTTRSTASPRLSAARRRIEP